MMSKCSTYRTSFKWPTTAGGMKRSGLRDAHCQPPPKFERETKPQIALKPLCFIPLVMVSCFINQIVKLNN
jgi:hypothetical protein